MKFRREQISVSFMKESDIELWQNVREKVAKERDVSPGSLSRTDIFRTIATAYLKNGDTP